MEATVTPARYAAPAVIRDTLRRFSTYDVETGRELALRISDHGDVPVQGISPEEGFAPIRDAALGCTSKHGLTLLLGGHNAVTRPAAHGLVPLDRVGLITLDAHFDLRDTDEGLMNGNPIQALLEDGLPGRNICQIGLAPFANTGRMHRTAAEQGIGVYTIRDCRERGIVRILAGRAPDARPYRCADDRFRHRRDRPLASRRTGRASGRNAGRHVLRSGALSWR